ncbi:DNA polymerase III subunit alpha [Sinimarinibacterium sp. NLF-5-8]|uniref:DNA polymerase III subunit alpha n=1 Tax=Sinimarinibacterium sp. NLF-5-8 TaxID=2698684 RepID=UPI00137B9ADE|nr:DNA polymerase III subunit alpha [Sinimarinibacterium sp. NLF-5-8]QHS08974.1 DNA polymerase III subunit alpha [Sinimarinibacterium sp. NLF-5-8]
MSQTFVHLRVHSEYSITDSIVRLLPPKRKGGGVGSTLTSRAAELGFGALALTDRNNLFAMVKFYKAAESAGIKPIIGVDVHVQAEQPQDPPQRLTLLVQNEDGYHNLAKLLSRGYTEGQSSGAPLLEWAWLQELGEGLLALSGREGAVFAAAQADQVELALAALDRLQTLFGDRLYLEISRCDRPGDEEWVTAACALSRLRGVPVVATNDVRFLGRDEFDAHEARVCIAQGRILSDPKRPREYTPEQYLKSADEMAELFADLPEALANSVEIARRCSVTLKFAPPYHLPNFPVPDGYTTDTWLRARAEKGLVERFEQLHAAGSALGGSEDDYRARLDYELGIIERMGFAGYFLVVSDFIQWAKTHGCPVGPGRGSGAGSLVAYVTHITDLDPLPYHLLFERFLNPERVSMPDFDVDFCMDNRDRVIEYVSQKYGREHVGQIITYATMAARGVIRDVARVLGHGYGFADSIAKLVPGTPGATLGDALEAVPELKRRYETEDDTRAVIDLGLTLEGVTRGVGVHAGGVVIAPQPLDSYTPLYCEPGGAGLRTQCDMKDLESIGLVKFDFLGLKTLTVIQEAVDNIAIKGPRIEVLDLPINDPDTYALYASGKTGAVFQMESPGMQRASMDLKPDTFEDIIALVSLYRPGPMDLIPEYCARKRGDAPVTYLHPEMEAVLQPTYGIFVYQEQVMQMSQRLAGYTLGGADLLRRAMGKKIAAEMAKQRGIFTEGSVKRGLDEEIAGQVFDLMEKFANYGFNKSHAAAYALVSYQTAWLKTHYPAQFMAAVLSCEMAHPDAVVLMREECLRMGLDVLPPNINESQIRFSVPGEGQVRYGLGAIKGVGEGALEGILAERAQNGAFKDLFDFCCRIDPRKVNKRVLEALIFSGALDSLGANRATLHGNLAKALQVAEAAAQQAATGQEDLFGNADDSAVPEGIELDQLADWTLRERLERERDTLGFYQSGHPIDAYQEYIEQICNGRLRDVLRQLRAEPAPAPATGKNGKPKWQPRNKYLLAAWVKDLRFFRGDPSAEGRNARASYKITVEDHGEEVSCWMDADVFAQTSQAVKVDSLVFVMGELGLSPARDERLPEPRLYAPQFLTLDQVVRDHARRLELQWQRSATDVLHLRRLLTPRRFNDGLDVLIHYAGARAACALALPQGWRIRVDDALLQELRQLVGVDCVKVSFQKYVAPVAERRFSGAPAMVQDDE